MRCFIGVDLRSTHLHAGFADEAGFVHGEVRAPMGVSSSPEEVIDQIVSCIDQVRAAMPPEAARRLAGVGVGVPGLLDPRRGLIFTLPHLPGWEDVPLRSILEQRTSLPAEIGNNAHTAVLAEWRFGGGRGVRNLVYVLISTGIGSGVIADGRLLLGHRGLGAEVGHHLIDAASRSSWEDLVAGPGMARAASEAMIAEPRSLLHGLSSPETVTAEDVVQAAIAGDLLAQRLLDRAGELIGIGLVNILYMYSPELILLGGEFIARNPMLIDRAMQVIRERALPIYHDVPVRVAPLGDRAGMLGAAALFVYAREGRA